MLFFLLLFFSFCFSFSFLLSFFTLPFLPYIIIFILRFIHLFCLLQFPFHFFFFPFTSFSLFQWQCFLSNQSGGVNEAKYMTFPFHAFIHSHQKSVPFVLISKLLTVPFVASTRQQNGKTITQTIIFLNYPK